MGGRREGGREWLGEEGKNGGWVIMKKGRRGERVEGGGGGIEGARKGKRERQGGNLRGEL